jgi:malate synthase
VAHGRVSPEFFEQVLQEELEFIRRDRRTASKRVEVKWEGEAQRWYPIAERVLRQLVTAEDPPEFASELLLPFTMDVVRTSDDPWQTAIQLCPGRYE